MNKRVVSLHHEEYAIWNATQVRPADRPTFRGAVQFLTGVPRHAEPWKRPAILCERKQVAPNLCTLSNPGISVPSCLPVNKFSRLADLAHLPSSNSPVFGETVQLFYTLYPSKGNISPTNYCSESRVKLVKGISNVNSYALENISSSIRQ